MPRFSVVVPAFNAEPFIRECLDSMRAQSFGDFEVVCVDDASTDATCSVIESYAADDSRFRLVRNERNMAQFASRHVGLAETTGEYILFLDADDALAPEALEAIDEQLASRPVDILQFGMEVVADPELGVEYLDDAWYARKYGAVLLEGDDIMRVICFDRADDMCVHHRAFRGEMARSVAARLGREPGLFAAEDIAELMAFMAVSKTYEVIEDAPFYIYNLGRGVNGNEGELTAAQFAEHSISKWKSYRALCDYIDGSGLHGPVVDAAIESRWRYACEQTLWMWQYSVVLEDHVEALVDLAGLWPALWVRPSVYQFLANDAQALIDVDEYENDRCRTIARRLAVNVEAVTVLRDKCGDASPDIAEDHGAAGGMLAGITDDLLHVFSGECEREMLKQMMRCLRAACFYERDTLYRLSDALRERDRLQEDLDSLMNSKSYRLGTIMTEPYRRLRSVAGK